MFQVTEDSRVRLRPGHQSPLPIPSSASVTLLSPTGRNWLCQFLSRVASWKGSSLSRSYSRTFTEIEGPVASILLTSSQPLRQKSRGRNPAPSRGQRAVSLHWCLEFELREDCLSPGSSAPAVISENEEAFPMPGGTMRVCQVGWWGNLQRQVRLRWFCLLWFAPPDLLYSVLI